MKLAGSAAVRSASMMTECRADGRIMADFGHAIGIPETPAERSQQAMPATLGEPTVAPEYGPPSGDLPPYAPSDPELDGAHAQARARAETGDLTGARTMLEEALAAGELRLGRSNPALVPLMVDVATLARRLGNLTEAANQLRRAYEIAAAASGPQHPTSLSIEGRLAAVLYRLGEATEAYDWHLADAGRRVLGEEHPAVRGAQQRLATQPSAPPFATPTPTPAPPPAPPQVYESTPAPPPVTYLPTPVASPAVPVEYVPAPLVRYAPTAPVEYPREPAIEGDIWESGDATVRTRRPGGGAILVVSFSAVIVVVVVVIAITLFAPTGPPPVAQDPGPQRSAATEPADPTPSAAPTSPAPTQLRVVEDAGGTVTLAWADPSAGEVPFVVSGARQGDATVAILTAPAGQTTATIYGLNENYDYCFTVAAVWSSEVVQESMRTCTHRLSASASASA
jgi:hypothetical protein